MNFLFVTDNSYQENNPTFNICMTLARHLRAGGHGVTVLGNSIAKNAPLDEVSEGIRFVRFYYPINPVTWAILDDWHRTRSVGRLALALLRHPIAALVGAVRAVTGFNPIVGRYARCIGRLCADGAIDAVVSFSAPYYTAMGLAKADANRAKKIVYMVDPYATHYEMGGPRATRQERRVLERADAAIVTPEIYRDYESHPLGAFRSKLLPEEFPCVNFDFDGPSWGGFDLEKINIFFAGNFYAGLRPATHLLQLIDATGDAALHFTIMGRLDETLSPEDAALRDELVKQGRLTVVPPQPPQTAYAAMREADILLNIGNNVPNMLPSKIYDYIVTGRPIVNLCQISGCPSLPRLERYPYALNLLEQASPAENAAKVEAFAREMHGRRTAQAEIAALYADCTPGHLCEVLLELARKGETIIR